MLGAWAPPSSADYAELLAQDDNKAKSLRPLQRGAYMKLSIVEHHVQDEEDDLAPDDDDEDEDDRRSTSADEPRDSTTEDFSAGLSPSKKKRKRKKKPSLKRRLKALLKGKGSSADKKVPSGEASKPKTKFVQLSEDASAGGGTPS